MGNLIDDLLQFSKTERQEMRQAGLDMNQLLNESIDQIKQDNQGWKIDWVISKLPNVYGYPSMLKLVWLNLLSNAVKFTVKIKRASIGINSYIEEGEIVLLVRDNGVGFSMKY